MTVSLLSGTRGGKRNDSSVVARPVEAVGVSSRGRVRELPGLRIERASGDRTLSELGLRSAALRAGFWLGWISIVAVVAGLALDVGARHRLLLVGLTLTAAAANAVAMLVPWQNWLASRRGRLLLDIWSGGLIAFVALLVVAGGSSFALLLFLAVPFIAVVQMGWRRGFWLAISAGTCMLVATIIPVSTGATAMRLALLAAAVAVALVLVRTIRREAAAHGRAAARADLERTLAKEANHRIKNDLQTVADLLLLGRPDSGEARAFDDTAARIRSIATVHRLLTEAADLVDAGALLRGIAEGTPVPIVVVETAPVPLDAATAQKVGIVANELITNAYQHGTPPIVVELTAEHEMHLRVDDSGVCGSDGDSGFGLQLVRRMVEQGLGGRFELSSLPGGGTRADVVFPKQSR
jgi:two-component sensor histidine kinase